MKKINTILGMLFAMTIVLMTGCEEDKENPAFADDAIPRIFGWSTSNKYFIDIEDPLILDMKVSPSDGATYKWFIDDVEVDGAARLEHRFEEVKTYIVKFEVERNGIKNSRQAEVIVTKPFVPKTYAKKVVGFMTRDGSLETIDLKNLTHLVISSAVVEEVEGRESLVDTTFTTLNVPLIVKAAHNEGIYVLLDVTGRLVNINGGGEYGNYGFYDVIKDSEKRDNAIEAFLKFAEDNDFDGINIYLNNASEDLGKLEPEVLTAFFNAIPAMMPEGPNGEFFYTASVSGGWLTSEFKPVVDVEAIDWVHLHPFRYGDPAITEDAPYWAFTDLAATWIGFGLPKEKIVNGIPACGLHYHYPDDGTTVGWGNMWMYTTYESYKSILDRDATAYTKNKLEVDDGIFYDGHPSVQQKAEYVVTQDFGGVMIWGVESDTKDQTQSLIKAASTALGN